MRDDDLRHWDSDRIRERHYDDHNYDADADLDRWLGYALLVIGVLGLWKILDLVIALVRWVTQ